MCHDFNGSSPHNEFRSSNKSQAFDVFEGSEIVSPDMNSHFEESKKTDADDNGDNKGNEIINEVDDDGIDFHI